MEGISKSVAFTDPISAVFELNEDFMKRLTRVTYLLEYAHTGGLIVTIISIPFLLAGILIPWPLENLGILSLIFLASFLAWWYGRQELRFLEEYRIRSAAVSRAKNWDPHPKIPDAGTPLDRLTRYLEDQDERFAYVYQRRPDKLEKDAVVQGKSRRDHHFDGYFDGRLFTWRRTPGPLQIFIRVAPVVRRTDLERMNQSVVDVLKGSDYTGPIRAILLQTNSGEISDEVIMYANQHPLEYERDVGEKTTDWASPIEVVAEDPSGVYNIGSFYFG